MALLRFERLAVPPEPRVESRDPGRDAGELVFQLVRLEAGGDLECGVAGLGGGVGDGGAAVVWRDFVTETRVVGMGAGWRWCRDVLALCLAGLARRPRWAFGRTGGRGRKSCKGGDVLA